MYPKRVICGFLLFLFGASCMAQTPALWRTTYSGVEQLPIGIQVQESCQQLIIWGRGSDTSCGNTSPACIYLDTSGSLVRDTLFDVNYCSTELPWSVVPNGECGIYITSINNVITPQDSSFVYCLDNNLLLQWSLYGGENITSNVLQYRGSNYFSANQYPTGMTVNKFNSAGGATVLNTVGLTYFPSSPQILLSNNGLILEIGSRNNVNDTAFVCQIYDTTGTYFTTFSFDANSAASETVQHASICSNQLFTVCYRSSIPKTYVASSGLTGIVNWRDTLTHTYRSACSDSINNYGYVLCNVGVSSFELFSYDLFSGNLVDSVLVDSASSSVSIRSGPAGGVYFMYTNTFTDQIILEQYDKNLDMIWSGQTQHPACTTQCTPVDFEVDMSGYAYIVSNCASCTENILVAKFVPSLVGLSQVEQKSELLVSPNPATEFVTITNNASIGQQRIQVFDLFGRSVFFTNSNEEFCVLDTSTLSSGVYVLTVTNSEGIYYSQKLIIQH